MATPQNGTVSVEVNGDPVRVKGPVTYSLGGKMREEVMGQTGMLGFKVTPIPSHITFASMDADDVDLAALQGMTDKTVTLNLENGKTITLDRASFVGPLEVSSEEGEFEIKFVGSGGREIG